MIEIIKQLRYDKDVQKAFASFDEVEAIVQTTIAIQQIPAPTGYEQQRAAYVCSRMSALGLLDVHIDEVNNVYGRRAGTGQDQNILIAAHTDTVFPADTDLTVHRKGDRISGPGIGDNSLGVAGLLHLAQALQRYNIEHTGDIWFVANVGEEGLGDLRGMRAAVDALHDQIGAAIALEGCDLGRIFHEAIGVRRYRITVEAPGGHSWGDFGAPSAIHTLVQLAEHFTRLQVPPSPRTTFNIGVIEGGTSINTIAQHASLLLDLRSADTDALMTLVHQVEHLVDETRVANPTIKLYLEQVGNRPAGRIDRSHPLVQAAAASLQVLEVPITYDTGSTDANIPLSRGIPAVCVAIGDGDHAHRRDEYIDTTRISTGMRALLLLTLAAASYL